MTWAVLCDFDHTITTEDVTDTLLEKHALPQWQQIESLWEAGSIGSRACMEQQIALLRATPAQVDAVADSIHIDPYFKSFAALCEKKHIPLLIVSDGLDYVIKHILKRHDLGYLNVIASHLAPIGEDRWQLTAPFANAGCSSQASTCKCAMSRQIRGLTRTEKMLYIGDGRSDYCVSMEEADLILAKDSLLNYCQKQQLPHRAFSNFAQASLILEELIQQDRQKLPTYSPTYAEEMLYA